MRLLAIVGLVTALWMSPAIAQAPCSFVLGFAEFSSRAGSLVGDCLEEQRTLLVTEQVVVPGYGPLDVKSGATVQATTHGLLIWDQDRGSAEFFDGNGLWLIEDAGLLLTRWDALGLPPPAPTTTLPVVAAPVAPAQPTPDPALLSRCVGLAGDLAEDLSRDLPAGSGLGGKAFTAFHELCRIAVTQHGERGFTCFETAYRRALRINRQARPDSSVVMNGANAEYRLCVSAR
jgi:hypothetical protein